MAETVEHPGRYATIQEIAQETGLTENFLYQRTRLNRLPGLVRAGRFVRVDRERFFQGLEAGEISSLSG